MIVELPLQVKKELDSLSEDFKGIGVDYIDHLVRSPEKETSFLNHAEWHDLYIKQNFKERDPYIRFAFEVKLPFFMWRPFNSEVHQGGRKKVK